ncbi:MAG: transcriptional regulator [Candidatus Wildermuthbacteria bacterium RIFCSPLOWO2_01_FULL_47_18]|uniref:Transcriptional regulator n=2 Tax=Candidatus Wildermuthiibacteriota TaxID=1817923 RepID=A0A1G2RK70_9BACT|nr:MAG: transcriptional regulator [Candidatus Wildermuthbacteria bacterium RIFCSPHIGHO2_02_FULL_48_16]OHA73240.1 MAG: transcriptional regulator [Candidatus Wildermuthbacteria bacterium RIFCSPLOWO2_01_FULL_47_18]
MINYEEFKRKALKNKELKQRYDALEPEFALITMLIQKRLQKKLTQKELAQKIGTKQSAISRLESGTYNPTLSFIGKVADALDASVAISLKRK